MSISRTLVIAVALASAVVSAQERFGTAAEAKAMLERAVTELKADPAAALTKFTNGASGFKDRDLYVFCWDMKTEKFTASGGRRDLIGTDVKLLKEKDGTSIGDKLLKASKEGTISTISYMFPRPGETTPVQKQSYVTRVGDQGCAVGHYK
jgi:signal transduction histidine kinase